LTCHADVVYHISEPYRQEAARSVRWDDPDLAIVWPNATQRVISERNRPLPSLPRVFSQATYINWKRKFVGCCRG
jgi:dTDP-4-dehydrorhamnose 3,5-epimerase